MPSVDLGSFVENGASLLFVELADSREGNQAAAGWFAGPSDGWRVGQRGIGQAIRVRELRFINIRGEQFDQYADLPPQ